MAVMRLNSRMITWEIWLAKFGQSNFKDVTFAVGPHTNSIRIRHGMSSGSTLTKKNIHSSPYEIASHTKAMKITSPSELDLQITCHSYLEDLFQPGCQIKIFFEDNMGSKTLAFLGEIRNLPYGGAKDMVNFSVKAFSKDINFSNQERNRTFKTRPLTRKAVITEIAALSGFAVDFRVEKDLKIKPNHKLLIQKGITDMELLDKLAKEWQCHWYFDDKASADTIIFSDGDMIYEIGDTKNNKSAGKYILGYRTDSVFNNVESVDWTQVTTQGGSETEAGGFSFNELGKEDMVHRLNALGKTWRMKPEYEKLAKDNPTAFRELTLYAADLTISGRGYDALRKFYEIDPTSGNGGLQSVTNGEGDNSGLELTIMLNEGDVNLRAPRSGILYAGGDSDIITNSNLPAWIFQHSVNNMTYTANLNIKESVLTYEAGILKQELKCSPRTGANG